MMNNSNVMDVSSVVMIINKLNFFIENEEKIIQNIKDSLSALNSNYSSNNNSIIESKIASLYSAMDIILENRKRYVDILKLAVERYVTHNEKVVAIFDSI